MSESCKRSNPEKVCSVRSRSSGPRPRQLPP